MSYFNALNYTLANEDTGVEWALLPSFCDHVVAVAGSGARVLPLLSKGQGQLTVVDMSKEQLFLCELRIEAARALSYQDFIKFLGYEDCSPHERRRIFKGLSLSDSARAFFYDYFEATGYESLLYAGRFEKFLLLHSKILSRMLPRVAKKLLHLESMKDQKAYFDDRFPWQRFCLYLFLFGNEFFYNLVLYKGHFPKKNFSKSFYHYYLDIYKKLFDTFLYSDNFYLQLLFQGKLINRRSWPLEAKRDIFLAAKKNLVNTKITYIKDNIVSFVSAQKKNIDFLSLSNVPSYFKGEMETLFYQKMAPGMRKDSLIVSRYYSHIPFRPVTMGFENVSHHFIDILNKDALPMYFIDIHKRLA